MKHLQHLSFGLFLYSLIVFIQFSYEDKKNKKADVFVNDPVLMDDAIAGKIKILLEKATSQKGIMDDSIKLHSTELVAAFYMQHGNKASWSKNETLLPVADSFLRFIERAREYGLSPELYHIKQIGSIFKRFEADSLGKQDRSNVLLWTNTDIMLTDAFLTIARHLHKGRLQPDSVYKRNDSSFSAASYFLALENTLAGKGVRQQLEAYEPKHAGYKELKESLKGFLDTAQLHRSYTYLKYPYADSGLFVKTLLQRLKEEGQLPWQITDVDAEMLSRVLMNLQKKQGLTADGKFGLQVVTFLNNTDPEKFTKIAINLDRYKLMPESLPKRYIWVNLPGYYLQVWEQDTLKIESKVIVGKSKTRTPLLNSSLTDIVTYPQWTIPNSIIVKEILPALKKNPGYLAKKGYMLLTWDGEPMDPYLVDWSKYSKGIPYKIVQGSGDDNALGILKFNFHNKYSVYLHDTNQRYLFKNHTRALSHGCVRVQEWEKLAWYVIRLDSAVMASANKVSPISYIPVDSVRAWLARKERHVIPVKSRLPVYFRYFTAEAKNGQLLLHPDIYGEDALVRHSF